MKKKPAAPFLVILLILIRTTLLLTSCTTAGSSQAGTLVWEGDIPLEDMKKKNRPQWELSISEDNRASLTLPYEEKAVIRGEAFPEDDGSWILYTDELEWFGNWEKGWTEAHFVLTGRLKLIPRGVFWSVRILEDPVIESVKAGTIRFGESKYYGDRAQDMISRRWTRIEAASRFIGEHLDPNGYSFAGKKGRFASGEYEGDLESLLFPEEYGYSPDFPETDKIGGDRYQRAEEIRWDTYYSEEYIPRELRSVRDSGTLFRDYREGQGLFVLSLTWQRMWEEEIPRSVIKLREE